MLKYNHCGKIIEWNSDYNDTWKLNFRASRPLVTFAGGFRELFGATRQTVSRWKLDQAVPEIQKIVQMARMLGVSIDSIISDGISTFDCTFDRFVCGVYRKKDIVIVETERIVLVYRDCGNVICSELYEGLQDNKVLRATVEFDLTEKKAKYAYSDDGGRVFANFEADSALAEIRPGAA